MSEEELYFVWRFDDSEPYRCYGTRNHVMPELRDMRCVWRGKDLKSGRGFARAMNQNEDRRQISFTAKGEIK